MIQLHKETTLHVFNAQRQNLHCVFVEHTAF